MESFIRSKYESKRWAMEGPPPSDPSVLEGATTSTPAPVSDLVSAAPPTVATSSSSSHRPVSSQPQPRHALLSTSSSFKSPAAVATQPAPAPVPAATKPSDDLFSLDFHAPTTSSPPPQTQEQKKDVKQDILSLFSTAPAQPQAPAASPWGQPQAAQQQQPTSMLGSSGAGLWGASSGWAPAAPAVPSNNLWGGSAAPAPPNNLFGSSPPPAQQPNLFGNSADIWGSSSNKAADPFGSFASNSSSSTAKPVKDDVFGDIWGGFK